MCEMPYAGILTNTFRRVLDLERRRAAVHGHGHGRHSNSDAQSSASSWGFSPATLALRNLLSPVGSPTLPPTQERSNEPPAPSATPGHGKRHPIDYEYVALDCSGSCRTIGGHTRNVNNMTERVVELVYFLRKVIEGRDAKGAAERNHNRRVLVHCQDGYVSANALTYADK